MINCQSPDIYLETLGKRWKTCKKICVQTLADYKDNQGKNKVAKHNRAYRLHGICPEKSLKSTKKNNKTKKNLSNHSKPWRGEVPDFQNCDIVSF